MTPWYGFIGAALASLRAELGLSGPQIQQARGQHTTSGYYAQESTAADTTFGRVWFGKPRRDLKLSTLHDIVAAMSTLSGQDITVEMVCARARQLQADHEAAIQRATQETQLSREAWLREVSEGKWLSPTSP